MEDQLIGFEVAQLAKKKGFDIVGNLMYATTGQPETFNQTRWVLYRDYCHAPTQSLLQAWLRQKKFIHVNVIEKVYDQYTFNITILVEGGNIISVWDYSCFYDTNSYLPEYEYALELALKHALEIIK